MRIRDSGASMNKEELAQVLRDADLNDYVDAIMAYAQPCIRLHARPTENPSSLPLGASHIGGLPDLPPSMNWPTRNMRRLRRRGGQGRWILHIGELGVSQHDTSIRAYWLNRNKQPSEFIAQINLAETSRYDQTGLLPRDGILLFFFDADAYPGLYKEDSKVIIQYRGDTSSLRRVVRYPKKLKDWQHYNNCVITFEKDWMLPNSWNFACRELEREVFQRYDRYAPVSPEVEAYEKLDDYLIPYNDEDKHHLFGYAEPVIQDDPLYHVPGANHHGTHAQEVMQEWMLLLQISSDDGPGMLWADTSSLYYMIRKDDLINRRFENAVCMVQFM
jgi:uncharacterized protein YwqG